MIVWLLTISMAHGSTTYGHFTELSNCKKVGANLVKPFKNAIYSCKLKKIN